jgi:hypothetical protein
MPKPFLPALLLMTCSLAAAPLGAQERPGAVYVTGGVTSAREDGLTGESSQIYVAAPGGTTRGWSVGGGVFVTDFFGVEVEVASTGVMTAREPSRYFATYNEERHDRLIAVNARWHLLRSAGVDLEPVVGAAFARRYARSQAEYDYWYLTPPRTEISDWQEHPVEVQAGVCGGADLRLGGRHLAALPSFRLFFLASQPADSSWYAGGAPSRWIVQSGVAVRATF